MGDAIGKVAVVTGESRGIGKQTCLLLAKRGVQIVIAARTEEPRANTPGTLGETAAELRAVGCDPLVVRADVGEQADLDRLVATTVERFGGVDIPSITDELSSGRPGGSGGTPAAPNLRAGART